MSALVMATRGTGFAMTLMACYGMPPCASRTDVDRDFYCRSSAGSTSQYSDCDDNDPLVCPDAFDMIGDGIEQNCDGIDG